MKHLGEYLDIHCGGIDNAFPHHTNEIAQSEAYLGHEWCKYWFHILHLNTNSGKMSKSTGEFLTVSLLESKGYDPLVYRFFCLQSHYRKSLVFSYENLDNAVVAYNKITSKVASFLKGEQGEVEQDKYDELMVAFKEALNNDLNTSLAITVVHYALKADATNATKLALVKEFDKVLGIGLIEAAQKLLENEDKGDDIPAEVAELAAQRAEARKAKNFALADELRDKITAMGYIIEETRQGTTIKKA